MVVGSNPSASILSPHRLEVRTTDFHSVNTGSIPVGDVAQVSTVGRVILNCQSLVF